MLTHDILNTLKDNDGFKKDISISVSPSIHRQLNHEAFEEDQKTFAMYAKTPFAMPILTTNWQRNETIVTLYGIPLVIDPDMKQGTWGIKQNGQWVYRGGQ